ncbi:MAG: histidine kinase [Lachnospiraceae bacterium]
MRKNPQTIHKLLVRTHLTTMIIMLVLTTAVFSVTQYLSMRRTIINNISQTCSKVATSIDTQISRIDDASVSILYSALVKNTFSDYMQYRNLDTRTSQITETDKLLSGLLVPYIGANKNIRQVNLYDLEQGSFGEGNYSGFQNIRASEQSWYTNTVENAGTLYIPPPAQNELLSESTGTALDRYYISLFRLYYNNFHQPIGIIEIMQYYDLVLKGAYEPESSYALDIMVFNNAGEVIYPLDYDEAIASEYYAKAMESTENSQSIMSVQDEYLYAETMDTSHMTTVVAIKKNEMFSPLYQYLLIMIMVLSVLAIFCFIMARKLSSRIVAPLTQIYNHLSGFDYTKNWKKSKMPDSQILEIDTLRDSFNKFQVRQKEAIDSMIILKQQEVQSQMLAYQSQMNPHFLYNSLATLNAMAEEGMTAEFSQMCMDITSILRYITSNKEPLASLEEELEQANRYLNCIKRRYQENLTCVIEVEDEMLEIEMPKLSIQLLAENAAKFTTRTQPPWKIEITGHVNEHEWVISVKDNGPGFAPEVMDSIHQKMEEIQINGLLPSLELDGMGLMNIYIRFYLLYHNAFIFDFGNRPEGGAIVSIGGKINE